MLSNPGTYWDTLLNANGCDSLITLSLDNHPIQIEDIEIGICEGDIYDFNGQLLTSPGSYSATLVSQYGCDSIVNLQLDFTNLVAVSFDANICPGDQYNFNGEFLASPGIYIDTLITGTGCDSLMTLTLDYYPQAFPEENVILCEGESINIGGIQYDQPTVVLDSSFLNGECLITTYDIEVIPETYIIAENVVTCPGEQIELYADSNGDIIWTGHASLSCLDCPNPTITVEETTEITIGAISCQGDPISRIITVEVEELEPVEITGDSLLVKGKSGIYNSYSDGFPQPADWYFDGELVCGTCQNFEFNPSHSGTLIAQSFEGGPCLQADTLLIDVRNDCSIIDAIIPNIITPNGDGANDVLRAELDNYAEFIIFRIYDRWGGLMFESNDPNFMWDGTYLGKSLNPGVYSYYFQVRCLNEKITVIKGNVTLLR
jgi:gliding motility-associated-like protein